MISSAAIADEILFRDIPWGSNAVLIENEMENFAKGYGSTLDDMYLPYWPDDPFDPFSKSTAHEAGWWIYTYTDALNVAGYPVINVDAYCHYGVKDNCLSRDKNDGEFYQARYVFDVIDIDSAYADLREKLCLLYGDGKETTDTGSGAMYGSNGKVEYDKTTKFTTWVGDSGTAVMLCSSTSSLGIEEDSLHNYLTLLYGKTTADYKLEKVEGLVKNEQMRAEAENAAANFDGL
jgi:hypothetical protein